MDNEQALLREYEKVVGLFTSEDRTAWELVSIYWVIQVGLISALVLTLEKFTVIEILRYRWFIFLIGGVVSLAWFFIQCRSHMWRENWLNFGLDLERQLNKCMRKQSERCMKEPCIELDIFEFEQRVREDKKAKEFFKNENIVRERKQKWWEQFGALRLTHWSTVFIAIIWFGLLLTSILLWLIIK